MSPVRFFPFSGLSSFQRKKTELIISKSLNGKKNLSFATLVGEIKTLVEKKFDFETRCTSILIELLEFLDFRIMAQEQVNWFFNQILLIESF